MMNRNESSEAAVGTADSDPKVDATAESSVVAAPDLPIPPHAERAESRESRAGIGENEGNRVKRSITKTRKVPLNPPKPDKTRHGSETVVKERREATRSAQSPETRSESTKIARTTEDGDKPKARKGAVVPVAKGDEAMIAMLAIGGTLAKAADVAGVSERTASRRWADPAFRERVRQRRLESVSRSIGVVTDSMVSAAIRLQMMVRGDGSEKVVLEAAKVLLNFGVQQTAESERERARGRRVRRPQLSANESPPIDAIAAGQGSPIVRLARNQGPIAAIETSNPPAGVDSSPVRQESDPDV
jgi:hypothetical protein